MRELSKDQPREQTVPDCELISTRRRPSYGLRPSTSDIVYVGEMSGSGMNSCFCCSMPNSNVEEEFVVVVEFPSVEFASSNELALRLDIRAA